MHSVLTSFYYALHENFISQNSSVDMNQYTLFSHVNKQAYTVNQNQNCLRMYNQSSTTWRPSQYESFIVCIQMDFRFGGFLFFFFFFYRTFVLEALTRSYQPCSSFDEAIAMTIHIRCFRHCVWPLNGCIMCLNLYTLYLNIFGVSSVFTSLYLMP